MKKNSENNIFIEISVGTIPPTFINQQAQSLLCIILILKYSIVIIFNLFIMVYFEKVYLTKLSAQCTHNFFLFHSCECNEVQLICNDGKWPINLIRRSLLLYINVTRKCKTLYVYNINVILVYFLKLLVFAITSYQIEAKRKKPLLLQAYILLRKNKISFSHPFSILRCF